MMNALFFFINSSLSLSSDCLHQNWKSESRKEEKKQMCPLRLILIFLSATLAGFFVLKKLNSTSDDPLNDPLTDADIADDSNSDSDSDSRFSKVGMAMKSGFWTCVDMASGRYLWNNLCSDSKRFS